MTVSSVGSKIVHHQIHGVTRITRMSIPVTGESFLGGRKRRSDAHDGNPLGVHVDTDDLDTGAGDQDVRGTENIHGKSADDRNALWWHPDGK